MPAIPTPESFLHAIVLTGPTGCGKTGLSLQLAEKLDAEIISMDSMALYRGMDILSAKPGPEERKQVPHHLIDVLDPWESSTVVWWLEQAAQLCQEIESRGRRALIVGGTHLYLKAMLRGLFDSPPADEVLRQELTLKAENEGQDALYEDLKKVDPVCASRLHPNDVRRVVRALEVWHLTGKPMSEWQQEWTEESKSTPGPNAPRCWWIDHPREQLYARINARAEQMIRDGLFDEVRALRNLPHPVSRGASQAVGYREACDHLDGLISQDEMLTLLQQRTRQYAKRQLTWIRHLPECVALPPGEIPV